MPYVAELKTLCSKSKFLKFMVTAADISIVTFMYVWLLDWSANFQPVFYSFFDFLYLSNKISKFFGYGFFDTTIKFIQML